MAHGVRAVAKKCSRELIPKALLDTTVAMFKV